MLSIAAMTGGQEAYYTDLAREDYYLNGGEPLGLWFGEGAEKLSLTGKVTREALSALFRGFSPTEDQKLVQNAGQEKRQPGWDLTFSAPKSVSTLWSQAPDEVRSAIQRIHLAAVQTALGYLQEAAGITRRGHDGAEAERAGLIMALFEHGTSRAQEPQLHTHCLVINASSRADGTWGAIRSHDLYAHKMTAGALYRAEFAYRLVHDLGLAVQQERKWFEIKGVSQKLMERFSTRRQEIEANLGTDRLHDARAAARAALNTREVKKHVARSELIEHWKHLGQELGFSSREVTALLNKGKPRSRDAVQLANQAIDELIQDRSFFMEQDVIRRVAESAQDGSVSAKQIRRAARSALESERILVLQDKDKPETSIYTTRELYELEQSILDAAERSKINREHVVSKENLTAVLNRSRFAKLIKEQRSAVERLTMADGAIHCMDGMAGTGKTYTLRAARETWEKQGFEVIGCALAARAARELEAGAKIKSRTLRATLNALDNTLARQIRENLTLDELSKYVSLDAMTSRKKRVVRNKPLFDKRGKPITRGMKLGAKTVIVLDEAGMVGTRDLAQLIRHVQATGAKLVLVGDEKQLPSIEAGAPFRSLVKKLGAAHLDTIIRQEGKPWMLEAVKLFANGDSRGALSLYAKENRLLLEDKRESAMDRLADDWMDRRTRDLKDTLVLAGTRDEISTLNKKLQQKRKNVGELGFRYVKNDGVKLREGDRVVFGENNPVLDVSNGDFGTIEHVRMGPTRSTSALTVRLDRKARKGIVNRHITVTFKMNEYADISLGYAVTTHKAQGSTVDHAFVLAGSTMQDRELSYVQMSRAREDTWIYATKSEVGEDISELVRLMERSRTKELAHDRETVPGTHWPELERTRA